MAMLNDATAAILFGGDGARLGGAQKDQLRVGGRTILERQLGVLRPLFDEVLLVGGLPADWPIPGLRVVTDRIPGRGAPGGVHAALDASRSEWVFCVACDMPFLRAEPILRLAERRSPAYDAVVPVAGDLKQPLFAFYSRRCLPTFDLALQAGNPALWRLLDKVNALRVPAEQLGAAAATVARTDGRATPDFLEDIDTEQDLARFGAQR